MKKKQTTMLLTALFTLGSTVPVMASSVTNTTTAKPTFSYNQNSMQDILKESNDKVYEELKERKDMLADTIHADSFKDLSLGEKLVLVDSYFTARADLHKESQKAVLSATDILELERLDVILTNESDNQNRDTSLISAIIQEIKASDMSALKPEEIKKTQEITEKMLSSYKDMRSAGRDLDTLITTQIKLVHSSQLQALNKFGTKIELSGDKSQTLELSKKMLKLTDGDIASYKKVSNLLVAENKTFFFVDNEVVELSIPLLSKDGGAYADISDMAKVAGFEITNEEKKLTVKNGDNILEINKEDQTATFNGQGIGTNFAVLGNGKLYLPIHSTFELFHYNVKWDKEIQHILINKQVYEENELDSIPVTDLVKGLFPEIPKEEVKQKEQLKSTETDNKSTKEQPTTDTKEAEKAENGKK